MSLQPTSVVSPSEPPALGGLLAAAAQRTPHAVALEAPEGRWTYAELQARVHERAAQLRAAGLQPGDRIGIAATRTAETIVCILAVVDAGLAYVPFDLAYPPERLQAMREDARPRAVVGDAAALAELTRLAGALPTLAAPAPAGDTPVGAEPDLTYVLFTSGSTGRPKGVAMGARPLAHLVAWHVAHPRLGQAARTLLFAPLSFDVHFQEIFSTIACGGTLVMLPEAVRRDPAQLHAALVAHRIARIYLPYVALQMLAQAAADAPSHLRDVVSAGEQLQVTPAIRRLFERLPDAALHNHYGPTESHVVTAFELTGDARTWPEIPPIGAPLPHVALALHDADADRPADGDTGELLIGGDTLAHGYLGRADLTAERFRTDIPGQPGRWYRAGDLVRRDADGVYTYLGRADQQLKVDGFRIEPGEIELALMAHAAVRDAVVTAPEIPGAGRQLVAHLVLNAGHAADTAVPQLRVHLRDRLPDYMVPVRFVALDALPTTPSGKIDRRALPLPAPSATARAADPTDLLALCRALWQDLLGLTAIGDHQNLFDLGARSLLVLRFVSQLKDAGVTHLSVADVYDRPTLAGLAADRSAPKAQRRTTAATGTAGIAIVGMATRTPGAADVDAFWHNLLDGREGIRHFAPHELDASVPADLRSRPNFVPARGVLDDADRFDAGFFGVPAREATVTDPQQRLMLELSWTALEHAGIDPARAGHRIGVYAGTANNSYIAQLRQEDPELVQRYGEFATMLASEKDYVATRIAHRLNLNGPALSIHTACSTGLVAVAQAWHALAAGQCDIALAGGATVNVPQQSGYLHVEGGMESADGHCRPFDAAASGTVFASGGAVVVLKRVEDALADGDTVYAVIRGVGLNNDGGDKASFTAPSVTGQSDAIRTALDLAGVDARSIGYVEAHGTGTSLGDPIEVAALTRAYRADTADTTYCGLGSLKSNLGHMVAAAGVAGLIKSALALHHGVIPRTLHYRQPNPQIDFAQSPFRVIADNTPWPRAEGAPRRAAVSSFGVGGTNAHAVLEEAPLSTRTDAPADTAGARWVLPLSARDADGVAARARQLADHLERHPHAPLAAVAATLMRGRKAMPARQAVVAAATSEAVAALRALKSPVTALASPRVVFLFPGQGSQHPGMARRLVDEAPAFRAAFDPAVAAASRALGVDLRAWLVDADPADEAVAARLAETRHAQPALFAVSYALAAWLDSLGITPDAMVGHSIGEYAAACHAGVMTLDAAVAAVIARGQAMFEQPRGAMLAVRTDADTLRPLLPEGVEIAGINAPALTVVAGSTAAIDVFAPVLEAREIGTTRLRVSHAFHSESMAGALPRVAAALAGAALRAPSRTLYSCVSGEPLTAADAVDPHYWARQVRAPVQFTRAVSAELALGEHTVFVEVGPGQALTALLRQHRTPAGAVPRQVALLGPANQPGDPAVNVLAALGALWSQGVAVAWPVAAGSPRATLPTYPFKDERHWFTRRATSASVPTATTAPLAVASPTASVPVAMNRLPRIEQELQRILGDVSGMSADDITRDASFVDQGLDSLSLTQATLEFERVFGIKLRFRRLLEDLDTMGKLAAFLDAELPADRFAPPPAAAPVVAEVTAVLPQVAGVATPVFAPIAAVAAPAGGLHAVIQQQMQLMAQQLALLAGQPVQAIAPVTPAVATPAAPALPAPTPAAPVVIDAAPSRQSLVEKPFGASPRLTLEATRTFTPPQQQWLDDFIQRYNARTGSSKTFSQQHRHAMADPRVVTGFNPLWKDLVYPIVVDRSSGALLRDIDGNEYIDLLSCFGANLLGYNPPAVVKAMHEQLERGIEVGPQHPMAADVAALIAEFTGMPRVGFCNTGSEAVMGAMRIARTVTGRKTIAIFTNSYHGIFDEVIVRGTKQLRSLSAAPGILANAVENILVLDWNSDESLKVLRERGAELAAIMTEPIQNKYPTVQPRAFVQSLREIADAAGCALIFDEVVTGFRVAPGGAQEFYGVRADIATYGKVIGGGLPFAAIAGGDRWLDALDGGQWQYGDTSYPEAGVTYFAGTFVRHPLALAAAHATLTHVKAGGRAYYETLNSRTQRLIDRLNAAFSVRGAPVQAVHCASLWRLAWDDNQKFVSLFYYLIRFHGLHVYEQFGHFVTEAMDEAVTDRIFAVMTDALDELMALGFITPRDGTPPPKGPGDKPAASRDSAPLTPGQTERWLAGGFDPNARRALNESFCVTLGGAVNRAALKAALQDVLGRHAAFRVQFSLDEPQQRLAPAAPVPVAEVDLRAKADADAALDAFCSDASRRDFAIDQAPLAAVSLLDLADGRTVVHVVASHLIFDGWASSVFNAELAEAYRARAAGHAPLLKPAESPLDFGAAEQARFAGADGQAALAFWRAQLANPPAPLTLGDRTPQGARTFAADTVRVRLDGDTLARLRAQAKRQSATLFQVLLAAVTVLLHRRSGRDDFVVSTPYASQSLQRHGPLMADGVLDLPLRLQCGAADDAAAVLKRVRNHLMDALEHPLMTQGTLARALGITSVGDRPPLTGVYFNLNPRVDLSGWAPLAATMFEGRKRGVLSELFFNFYETDDALTLDLHHGSEFFSPAAAQSLVDELMAQCRVWADGIAGPAAAIPQTAAPSVDPRLLDWNRTDRPLAPRQRLERWVAEQAERTPDATAVVAPDGTLTHRALDERANRFAQVLRARGAGPGQLVGICLGRGVELLPALLGVLKTGAAYVPLDPGFPKDRLQYMAEDAALHTVVTERRHAELAGLPRERQLRVDDDDALIAAASTAPVAAPHDAPEDAPAYVIYTSGSTGKPKGVVLPQQAVCNFVASMRREPGLAASDRLLAVTTLSFDIAVLELFVPLVSGATVVLAQREDAMDADALAALIGAQRINVMQATPTTWHLMLDAGWRAPAGFRALCGGEPLPAALASRLLAAGVELWNMYGPTETTVWSTLSRIADASQRITIGRPIDNTQVWVLDDQGRPCAVGAEGEICIGGTGVANGYFKRPELTADRFVKDPFSAVPGARLYRTGDLGRWGDDGQLHHLGRLDFQVKVRGYRIELGEIEARLEAQPGVARTVVVAREDEPGDVRLVGYLVAAPGASPDAAQLRVALKAGLPDYMVPQHLVVLDTMPLLPNGKIDRKALPAPRGAAAAAPAVAAPAPAPVAAPASDLVAAIAATMADVMGLPAIGADDHFFELGGHSLQAAKLATRLAALVGARPSLRTLFDHPTPRRLAAALGAPATSAAPAASSLRVTARTEQHTAPLSLMQQRLWFLESLQPGTPFNQLPSAHRLSGPLDEAALKTAVQQLVDRQAALRTVIERTPEGPRQRVRDHVAVDWAPTEDLRDVPAAQRDQAVIDRVAALTMVPIDFEHGPAFRVHLFRTADDEHVFFFMVHHLFWDGASFDVLYRDMAALYAAAAEGRPSDLPAPTLSYGDYAAAQRDWMQGDELRRQVEAWRQTLTPLPEVLQLPTDKPRPARMTGDGASRRVVLPLDLVDALRGVARRHGVTLSTLMLSAYAFALQRLSGQDDFAIATPVRGRDQPELEPLAGFFVNALPLRMRPQGSLAFTAWSTRVQQVVADAFANPDVPFEHLTQALEVPRDTTRPMLAQALYSFQDARERPQQWGALRHSRVLIGLRGAGHDLSLYCVELRAGLECALTYNADVFDAPIAALMLDRIEHVLRQIVASPETRLADLSLAHPSEAERLAAWNRTPAAFDRDTTVHATLAASTAIHPDAPAVTEPNLGTVSHAELDARANRLARVLRARGIGRGQLVGLCIDRGIAMVVAQLAILKAGAAYVPLDPAYPTDRLAYMAEDAKLALLVTESALVHALDWPRARTVLVDIDAETIAAQAAGALAPDAERDARATDPAYVIYTSGSTGKPKGVMVPHRAVVNFLHGMAREPGLDPADRLVAVTTLSFDIAVLELLVPLLVGAQVIVASRETTADAVALRELLDVTGATAMQATPSTWRMLVESGWQGRSTFKALVGGEALPSDLAALLKARTGELWNMYGPTETTVWSTCWRVGDTDRIVIGRPIANTQVHVLDGHGRACPIGVPGELFIGGEGVTLGYLERPQLTAERFVADPSRPGATMYRTGDRGRWRHDGQLEHLGRLDFQVKVRGHRIELGEIESNLALHPSVTRVLVIVREDEPGDTRLVAYVVPRGDAPSPDTLREHLRATLPDYMLPQHVVFLDAIPLLPNGKTDRHALPAPAATATAPVAGVAARTATELAVVEAWRALLGTSQVGVTDDFFSLGGHSLLAMRLSQSLGKIAGRDVRVRVVFDHPTPEAQARWIDSLDRPAVAEPAPAASRVPARADQQTAPLSPMQQRLWYIENLTPGTTFNQLLSAQRLDGPLDLAALRNAVQAVVDHQPSLRTRIERTADGVRQRVLDHVDVPAFVPQDFTDANEDTLRGHLRALLATPLDLAHDQPFRLHLLRVGRNAHVLAFVVHHLVWDGASFTLLYQQLAQAYAAALAGRPAGFAPLAVTYGDFARWQTDWLDGAELRLQLDHWREALTPLPEPLELPADRPRPSQMTGRGESLKLRLDPALTRSLQQLARTQRVTVSTLLLSAYALQLQHMTGQDDFVVATPVLGRDDPALAPVMGFFANTLPLRLRFDAATGFDRWASGVQSTVADAFSHPDVPFDHLVRVLDVPRDLSRPVLAQVLYSFQDVRERSAQWGDLQLSGVDVGMHGATHDLSLYCYERQDGISCVLNTNSDIFAPDSATRFLARFEQLLRQVVRAPATALADFTLATPEDREQLSRWNATDLALELDTTVHALTAAAAARHADRVAVTVPGTGAVTHGELDARANRLARLLRERGIGRGQLVGLCIERGIEMVVAQLAVLKAGAAYVPLDPAYPSDRLAYMADDAKLALLVTESALVPAIDWPRECAVLVDADRAVIATQSATALSVDATRDALPTDPAYVIYTSGSTGKPKGVMVPHRAVVNFLHAMAREPGLTSADRLVAVTTLSFDIAVLELLLPLTVGAEVVLASRETALDPIALRELVESSQATVMQATPSTWRMLIASGWQGNAHFKALIGGEGLPSDLAVLLKARTGELWNMYGPTETTVWSTCWRVTDTDRITIGRPIANTQVHILDPRLQPCAPGVPGEIWIGGDGVTLGYLHRPELTAERFVADPARPGATMYRTGDRGRWRHDGQLEHLGRLDFQVKVRGYRIELGEIESTLASQPQVAQSVVIVREDQPGDTRLVAYVVPRGEAPTVDALREHLRASLPEYMLPQHVVFLDAIPLLPNGKTNRHALPAPGVSAEAREAVAPRTPTERAVVDLWQSLLGLDQLSVTDNFFSVGGHSLLAMRLSHALGQLAGRDVRVRAVFDHPTPEAQARWLDTAGTTTTPAASRVPARADQQTAPLSLMQQRLWYIENLTPGTTFNQLLSAQRLDGPLDLAALRTAVQAVVDHQPSLRTRIERTSDGVRQRVLDHLEVPAWVPEEVDGADDAVIRDHLRALLDTPLDLAHDQPFRLRLLRLSPNAHVLGFLVHHLVWDGASFTLLFQQLAQAYTAALAGRPAGFAPLAVTYGDFAEWQTDCLDGPELRQQVDHWRATLTPLPEPLELPTDRPRLSQMSGRGDSRKLRLDVDLLNALQRLARSRQVTLSTLLLSAYALQLQHMTRQDDLIVAVPVLGRNEPSLAPVMGFFANALPLRLRVDPSADFDRWTSTVQSTVADAFSHPDVPFDHLVRVLDVPRDLSRPVLAQVLYSFQDVRERGDQWGELRLSGVDVGMHGATHDLALYCYERHDGVVCVLNTNGDVFDADSGAGFLERFELLLRQIVEAPATALADFTIATPEDHARLTRWNSTDVVLDLDTTVHAVVAASALAHGDAPAVTQPNLGTISHAELDARANQLARLLRERGIGRGQLVGLCIERGIEMVVAQLAILKAGAAYVPLDPAYPSDRLAYMAEDAKLALLVTESALVHALDWPRARSVLVDIDGAAIATHPASAVPADGERDARPTDPAYVIYTSGSTGKPKGVMVPHRAVVNFLHGMAREPGLDAADRLVAVTTLSFDIAVLELLLPLTVGAEVILASRETAMDSQSLRELVESSQSTVMQATPSTWRMLIASGWQGNAHFKALIGGEGLPSDLAVLLKARTGELWNMYGPTETTVWSTCWRVTDTDRITIGRPIANTQVHILDPRLQPCAPGVPGEIWIGGDGVTLGYLHRPELTAERFVADPARPGATMYRTGDRGRWRHDGQLEHLGRLDFQVKVRGYRIELGEIESTLASQPQVAQSVVIVREDQPGDTRLVAYVVPRGEAPTVDALREHLRASLPEYMLPQHVVFLDAIPLLPNGKTNRHALPAPAGGADTDSPHRDIVAPRNGTEATIAEIWAGLIGVKAVGATDNFFDLGGHSLLAMRAVLEIEKRLGVRLNVRRMIFESLAQIAGSIEPVPQAAPAREIETAAHGTPSGGKSRGLWGRLIGALRGESGRSTP